MSVQGQSCANCHFWSHGPGNEPSSVPEHRLGAVHCQCRRFPPTVVVQSGYLEANVPYTQVEHAFTESQDWCGEWQAAEPQTVDDAAAVMARAVLAGDATAGRALADRLIELISPPPAPEPPT